MQKFSKNEWERREQSAEYYVRIDTTKLLHEPAYNSECGS